MPYVLQYLDYIDLSTHKTLVCTPGSAYTIAVASGRNAATPAYPNDGRWTSTSNFVAMEFKPTPAKEPAALPPAPADDTDKPKEGANNARN